MNNIFVQFLVVFFTNLFLYFSYQLITKCGFTSIGSLSLSEGGTSVYVSVSCTVGMESFFLTFLFLDFIYIHSQYTIYSTEQKKKRHKKQTKENIKKQNYAMVYLCEVF